MWIRYFIFVLLVSCGFKPLYGVHNQEKVNYIFSQVKLDKIPEDSSLADKIIFKQVSLELSLTSNDPRYLLVISNIVESDAPLDLDRDGNASEYSYSISLVATLHNMLEKDQDKKVIFSKSYSSVTNLNVSNNYYASQVSKRHYRSIIAKNIAEELKNYLIVSILNLENS